jgi:F0F1-type ATP synthase membrane subunit b/b'
MTSFTVEYRLSNEARNRILVETGQKPEWRNRVNIDMGPLSLEQRQAFVSLDHLDHGVLIDLGSQRVKVISYKPSTVDMQKPDAWLMNKEAELDWVPGESELVDLVVDYAHKYREARAQVQPLVDQAKAEAEAREAETTRLNAAVVSLFDQAAEIAGDEEALRQLRSAAPQDVFDHRVGSFGDVNTVAHHFYNQYLKPFEEARKEAKRVAAEAEKAAWIEANGSNRLKLAITHGHDVTRIYAQERAAKYFPGWTLDFYREAEWNERTNPPWKNWRHWRSPRLKPSAVYIWSG